MNLQVEFKEETGQSAYDLANLKYNEYYVEWLEEQIEQLRMGDFVGQSEQLTQNFCTLNQQTCGKGSECKYPHCHL